jgi:tetratricopeptide (TPR) repeat protein
LGTATAAALLWGLVVAATADDRGPTGAESLASNPAAQRTNAASSTERIRTLIEQLGSPRFSDRRASAHQLNQIGPEAFDQLQAATDAADPEIAASARYLLQQINVRWARSDDSKDVRQLLRNYGDQETGVREQIVIELRELSDCEGVAALCRIARFDRSPLVSRQAAAAVIHSSNDDVEPSSTEPELIERELGTSNRLATLWLRQYQLQLRDPAASVPDWNRLIDEEADRLEANAEETSTAIVSALLWNLADVYDRLGETAELEGVFRRIVAVNAENSDATVWHLLRWMFDRKAWQSLDQFAVSFDARIRETKPSLYLLAVARAAQGQSDAAETLADEALRLELRSDLESISAAQIVAAQGHDEWAVREYRRVLGEYDLDSAEKVWACNLLSSLLQDYEKYQEAAEVLSRLTKKLGTSGPSVKKSDVHEEYRVKYQKYARALVQIDVFVPEGHAVPARYHYLRACYFEQQHDWPSQRNHLSLAIGHDEEDVDVLIAMYHVEDADEAWRTDALKRIQSLADQIDKKFENVSEDEDVAKLCNQWAWLIANTEGDFDKAIRYSQRSLELGPDIARASYLDTLGRCYFAAGDLQNAVKHQRQAVELIPHMQVMRRQLAQFEQALAKEQGTANSDATL